MRLVGILLITFVVTNLAQAGELFLNAEEALRQGYKPVSQENSFFPLRSPEVADRISPHSLSWPVDFEDRQHTLGNSMLQFQKYFVTPAYYHGGCDLRAEFQGDVRAPVSGELTAGYYSYDINDEGKLKKFYKPWPDRGQRLYFEIAITTADGLRFEFHHVDPDNLPSAILEKLNSGSPATVKAGDLVGHVIAWPRAGADGSYYHHIHYNILMGDISLNPEFYSELIPDDIPPVITHVFGIDSAGQAHEVSKASADMEFSEIVIGIHDYKNHNVYRNPPDFFEITYQGQVLWQRDFRQSLNLNGWQPIFDVYKKEIRTSSGWLRTSGDYTGENFFLFKATLSQPASQGLKIRTRDQAGNSTTYTWK